MPPIFCAISSSALRCASLMRGDDQILQHLDVVFRDDLGIDLERLHLLGAVDDDGDHAAAGVAFDRAARPSASAGAPASAAPASSSAGCSWHSHLLDVADLRRETLRASPARRRRRAPARAAPIFLSAACRPRPPSAGAAARASACTPPTAIRRPRDLLRDRFEPGAVLLEHVAQRALVRRKRERHAVAGDLDLLRLRHDRVVEHDLRLADLGEKRVLEVAGRRAGCGDRRDVGRRRDRPACGAAAVLRRRGAGRLETAAARSRGLRRWRRCRGRRRACAAAGRAAASRRGDRLPAIRSSIGTSLRRWIHRSSAISR